MENSQDSWKSILRIAELIKITMRTLLADFTLNFVYVLHHPIRNPFHFRRSEKNDILYILISLKPENENINKCYSILYKHRL